MSGFGTMDGGEVELGIDWRGNIICRYEGTGDGYIRVGMDRACTILVLTIKQRHYAAGEESRET